MIIIQNQPKSISTAYKAWCREEISINQKCSLSCEPIHTLIHVLGTVIKYIGREVCDPDTESTTFVPQVGKVYQDGETIIHKGTH